MAGGAMIDTTGAMGEEVEEVVEEEVEAVAGKRDRPLVILMLCWFCPS